MTTHLRIEKGKNLTAGATAVNGIVVSAAPILRRFIGQPVANLKRWADKYDEVSECKEHYEH